jgi:outer membrane immunogenic protein
MRVGALARLAVVFLAMALGACAYNPKTGELRLAGDASALRPGETFVDPFTLVDIYFGNNDCPECGAKICRDCGRCPYGSRNCRPQPVRAPTISELFAPNNQPYVGIQAGYGWGQGDMTHPFAPAATNANINGGIVGLFGGTRCFTYDPRTGTCVRLSGSVNWSGVSGSSPPNFGGEINRSRIGWFVTANVEVDTKVQQWLEARTGHGWTPQGGSFGPPSIFIAAGPAWGSTKVDFAGDTTNNTSFGWNVQVGVKVPLKTIPNTDFILNYTYVNLGSTSIPTAAGTGHVDFEIQAVMTGAQIKF